MSAVPARFTFDLDLGHRPADRAPQPQPAMAEAALVARIEDARREAHAQGVAEGERTASVRAQRQLAAAIDALANRAAQFAMAETAQRRERLADAVDLALVVARKLSGAAIDALPQAPLETLLSEALASVGRMPGIVIRCHPDLVAHFEPTATRMLAERGLEGRVVIVGDATLAPGDGRVEWADGGIARDSAAIAAEVDRAISAFLATDASRPETTP
ncbi:flagellar assembly protein FliH [Devosia enhydra]|uniref:Flagellar assembly protein FliH n=1 Tax=Devosia enhydra TaxID=665118 RepID=A0A1K2HYB0_9HYPH|nr:FliH/SctL family protein [Devosia enhydra]SFZ83502.1 flagellar assembly protein FliH [Devosia enhydra]